MKRSRPIVGALLIIAAGCSRTPNHPDQEQARLADPPPIDAIPVGRWLPTGSESRWDMIAVDASPVRIAIRSGGPVDCLGRQGTLFRIERDGQPWREEVLGVGNQGLTLMELRKPGGLPMRLDPPMPMTSAKPIPGEEAVWNGVVRVGADRIPARGYCVVIDCDRPAGRPVHAQCIGVDSVVELLPEGRKPIPFPVTRWLHADRGYARLRLGIDGRVVTFGLAPGANVR